MNREIPKIALELLEKHAKVDTMEDLLMDIESRTDLTNLEKLEVSFVIGNHVVKSIDGELTQKSIIESYKKLLEFDQETIEKYS